MMRLLLKLAVYLPFLSALRTDWTRTQHSSSMKYPRTSFNRISVSLSSTSSGFYLQRMVERKKIEVNNMLKRHQDPNDPIFMRMTYMSSECKYNVTRALKTASRLPENARDPHQMTVLIDVKKKSPTIPTSRNIVEFSNAGKFCELLTLSGTDAFFVNTDEFEYGGSELDLKECAKIVKIVKPRDPPAIIHKDIIIHPVQV